jgi:hypothetical protein
MLTQPKEGEDCHDNDDQANQVNQSVHFRLLAFMLKINRSHLLLGNAVFGRVHDPFNTCLDVFGGRFRAIRRQPLLARLRSCRLDDVTGKGRRIYNLLTGDLRG